jgi:enoyl-CoA hydratase/carnithine racemase
MMCQLSEIVSDLEHWSNGRAVLLRSDDQDFFCSGADLTSTVIHINRKELDLVLQDGLSLQ